MSAARPLVVVVGAGGIGQPAIAALPSDAVRLRVIDDDRVDVSNLHRLPLAREDDVGRAKVEVALHGRAPGDERVIDRATPETIDAHVRDADLVIDACDNYATRFLVADACGLRRVPVVHGAAVGWLGTVFTVVPGATACYRCLFEEPPGGDTLDCASAGVYGPVTSVVGALMAADALRLLRGDRRYAGAIGTYDGWRNTFRTVPIASRSDCPLCGTQTIRTLDASRYTAPACVA